MGETLVLNNFSIVDKQWKKSGHANFNIIVDSMTEIYKINETGKMNQCEKERNMPRKRVHEIKNFDELQNTKLKDIVDKDC